MARGHYTFDDIESWTDEQVYFIWHYQEKVEQAQLEKTAKMLGLLWTKEDFEKTKDKSAPNMDRVFIPLSLILNPKLKEEWQIEKNLGTSSHQNYVGGGEYKTKKDERILSMDQMTADEFKQFMGQMGVAGLKKGNKNAKSSGKSN